jgi:6-phosphofructokinase 1
MIDGDLMDFSSRSVSNIIQRGGTILKSARSERFIERSGRDLAFANLKKHGIDALVAIGGDGTFKGAQVFEEETGIPVIGVPGTIDNDLAGTDFTLGFDTAVNTAVDAIDKIRDTAASHDRLFIIEVMGRDAGYIALYSGTAGGAESILLPETMTDLDQIVDQLEKGRELDKSSNIIVVAEGDEAGGAAEIADKIRARDSSFDIKVTILGHIQRGGSPTVNDRLLGSRLGVAAVEALLEGRSSQMAGIINNEVTFTTFTEAIKKDQLIDRDLLKCNNITSI